MLNIVLWLSLCRGCTYLCLFLLPVPSCQSCLPIYQAGLLNSFAYTCYAFWCIDFELSDTQCEHALAIERIVPSLSYLRTELCSTNMSEACFWKIYFVLLHSKLNMQDAELLSTTQVYSILLSYSFCFCQKSSFVIMIFMSSCCNTYNPTITL